LIYKTVATTGAIQGTFSLREGWNEIIHNEDILILSVTISPIFHFHVIWGMDLGPIKRAILRD
jgi:hypothetical protein